MSRGGVELVQALLGFALLEDQAARQQEGERQHHESRGARTLARHDEVELQRRPHSCSFSTSDGSASPLARLRSRSSNWFASVSRPL